MIYYLDKGGEQNGLIYSKRNLRRIILQIEIREKLKQISLRETPLKNILEDIERYRASYIDVLIQENLIGSRFKSDDSIMRKYEKTIRTGGGFKQCFNDILGFRLRFEKYPKEYPDYFRVVDLRNGKMVADGYRAIHLYYQRDNLAYPIEIQLWCGEDYLFNIWSHRYIYKYKEAEIGKLLYEEYAKKIICSEQDFIERLKYWKGKLNGR